MVAVRGRFLRSAPGMFAAFRCIGTHGSSFRGKGPNPPMRPGHAVLDASHVPDHSSARRSQGYTFEPHVAQFVKAKSATHRRPYFPRRCSCRLKAQRVRVRPLHAGRVLRGRTGRHVPGRTLDDDATTHVLPFRPKAPSPELASYIKKGRNEQKTRRSRPLLAIPCVAFSSPSWPTRSTRISTVAAMPMAPRLV